MMNDHNKISAVTWQNEENIDNYRQEWDGSGSILSLFDSCPDESEDETLDEDCEWRIPQQYQSPAKQQQHLTVKQNRIGKSDPRLSIKNKIIDSDSHCQKIASEVTIPSERSSLLTASNLSLHSSSFSSSSHQSIISTNTTATTTRSTLMMVRRPSTRSHRYLDDECSLGPDGSDIFTICDSTSSTHHHCMEQWVNQHNQTIKNDKQSSHALDSYSRIEAGSPCCFDDGNESCYSGEREWLSTGDMTVWSLDWTERAVSTRSPTSSHGSIQEYDWRNLYLFQGSPVASPLCPSDATNACGEQEEEEKSPLLFINQINLAIHSESLQNKSRMCPSANPRFHSIKTTRLPKGEIPLGYQKIHREASKVATFLQLPELNCLSRTNSKPLSHQLSWSEKTEMTDVTGYSTSSDSMDKNVVPVVTRRRHVSWDENSLSSNRQHEDEATTTETFSPSMEQIVEVDFGVIGWGPCPTTSTSDGVGMWTQCDEDAVDSGTDWLLCVVTGYSDVDETEMFHVHRTVLIEASTFFRRELLDKSAHEEGYSIVELDKSLLSAIPDMLDFIYRHKYSRKQPFVGNSLDPMSMDPATAFSLRQLGDYFGVDGLKEAMDQLFD